MVDFADALIVGSGHAGAQAAIALRQHGFTETIAIVSDEQELPYERPPLSKDYLAGAKPFERLLIRKPDFWADREIRMMLGRKIVDVNPDVHRVTDDAGNVISYGRLIWAAGGRARRMSCSGHDFAGVHSVRTRADVDRMITELPATKRVVVIGGGYIGLEAAAVLNKLGKTVTVVEALDRVLARVTGETLSRFFEEEHRSRSVELRLSTAVNCLQGKEGRVTHVRLEDGQLLEADMVVVGIGIVPVVEPLIRAGAEGSNGVSVDEYCRTSLGDIYAIGDCALHTNYFSGGAKIRLESVQNANDMAAVVANELTGSPSPYHTVPWFWSNQYDLRLQTVGIIAGHDEEILRGDLASRSFSVVYRRGGRVVALDCVNATKDYVQGRRLVVDRARTKAYLLANSAIELRSLPVD